MVGSRGGEGRRRGGWVWVVGICQRGRCGVTLQVGPTARWQRASVTVWRTNWSDTLTFVSVWLLSLNSFSVVSQKKSIKN